MIFCPELNKSFESAKEMHLAIKDRLADIISFKKEVRESDRISISIPKGEATKADTQKAELQMGDTVKAIINTTNYLDSHGDVHINGIWDKSVPEQQGKIYHVADHQLAIDKVVAYPSDVFMELVDYKWSELGRDYSGSTQALVFNSKMSEDTIDAVFKAYKNNRPVEHSVRMQYVNLFYAVNDPEIKEEYANWLKYYPVIGNKDVADKRGYFWAVTEAKISREGSTVLFGSNDATPYNKIEPLRDTQNEEESAENRTITEDADKTKLETKHFL